MRRLAIALGCILGGLIALIAILIGVANTGPGRRTIESLAAWGSGGTVRLTGLAGRFPDALKVGRLELADKTGVYAVMQNAALDWSPSRLIGGTLAIGRLDVGDVTIQRPPVSDSQQSSGSSGLPVAVELRVLHIGRLAYQQSAVSVDGTASVTSLAAGQVQLTARALDGSGTYTVDGGIGASGIQLHATVKEPAHGMLSTLAALPDLGAIAMDASLDGPKSALTTHLKVDAGPLHAGANGTIDLQGNRADLTVEANAPAMQPAPNVAWQSIALNAQVTGPFTAPQATGHLRIERLTAGTGGVDSIAADLSANTGQATLHATLSGIHGPNPAVDALMKSPIQVDATAQLNAPDRPVRFTVHQDLASIEGTASTAGQIKGHVALTVPDLTPLSDILGTVLHGKLEMTMDAAQTDDATNVTVDGKATATGAPGPMGALIGDTATLHLSAALRGQTVALNDLQVGGHGIALSLNGTVAQDNADLRGKLEIPDLGAIRPDLAGKLQVDATVHGPPDNLTAQADLTGSVAAAGVPSGPLNVHVDATNLPNAPEGTLTAHGALLGAPVTVDLTARRLGNAIEVVVHQTDWKTTHAEADVRYDQATGHATGNLRLTVGRFDDFAPLLGQPLSGGAAMTVSLTDQQAHVQLQANNAALPGAMGLTRGTLDATIKDPFGTPSMDADATFDGLRVGGAAASVSVKAHGPANAIAVTVAGSSPNLAGAPLKLSLAGTIDTVTRQMVLASAEASWHQKNLRLLAPVRISAAGPISVDRLRLGLDRAVLDASGQISPALGLNATLRDLPADLAEMFVPGLALDGSIGGEVHLTGNPAQPAGTIKIAAKGLRSRQGFGRTLPAASIDVNATLQGGGAQVDVRAAVGSSRLAVTGRAPMAASGALNLRVVGNVDLAVVDPILAAGGRHVAGQLTVNAATTGSVAKPTVNGTVSLANGEVRDTTMGLWVHAIAANLELAGDTLRVTNVTAKADPGTITVSGSVGVLAPGMPIDLTIAARNARPLSSDTLTATLDADITVRGPAASAAVGGTIHSREIDIRIPEKLPASVATIPVRDPAKPPPLPPGPPGPSMTLNVAFETPGRVFIRGRGIDVELGGQMRLGGTTAQPRALGALTLRQGTIAFAGQTLTFSKGTIGFNGAGIADPSLDLESTTSSATTTATLTVGGTASAPKITLSSVPELPQDEVLSQLLFKRSVSSLSPLELAQIAAGLASLTGAGSGIGDPLSKVRQSLGLDRLSVGTTASGAAAVEAGRYVARGVYVGTKQGASGGGQATVRIDIAKGLTVRGSTSTGGSATGAGSDTTGSSVGVGYEFQY